MDLNTTDAILIGPKCKHRGRQGHDLDACPRGPLVKSFNRLALSNILMCLFLCVYVFALLTCLSYPHLIIEKPLMSFMVGVTALTCA